MTKAEGYRKQAEFCDRQAKTHADAQVKAQFTLLARQWRELAEHVVLVEQAQANAARFVGAYGLRVH